MKQLLYFCLPTLLASCELGFGQTPDQIDGLRLWLDASDSATIGTSGGKVLLWEDKSGYGNHAIQNNAARQPSVSASSLAGQPAIHFDAVVGAAFTSQATDDGLLIKPGTGPSDPNAFSLNRNYTAYLVDQYWGAHQNRTLTNVDNSTNWLLGHWNGAESHYTGNFIGPNVGAPLNQLLISEAVGTGASNYLTRNGRSIGYAEGNLNNPGRIALGEDDAVAWSESSQFDVGQVIAYNRGLTDTERWVVQDYLNATYNRPAGLSRAHATRSTVFTGGDDGEGLDLRGNFIAAVNVGGPGGFTIGDAAFTSDTGVVAENHIPGWFPAAFGGATPTANDTNLNTAMQSIRWSATDGAGTDSVDVTVPGLIPGETYKVQLLFAENTPNHNRHFAVNVEGRTINPDYAEASYRGTDNPNGLGNALVHEFVAKDTTLTISLSKGALGQGDTNSILNAYTVERRGVTGVTTTSTFKKAADLDFSGTFVYAVNTGGTGGQVIGNATFTTENTPGVRLAAENQIAGWAAGANFGATPEDAALSSVVGSIRWNETNGLQDGLSVDLTVITGHQYKLQLLSMEACCDRAWDVAFEGVRTLDNYAPASMGATVAANTGAVITHIFTAQDNTFSIMLDGYFATHADRNPILNGFTLEDITPVPEPTALGLVALAGLVVRRRARPVQS
jgi:hypothetical protein